VEQPCVAPCLLICIVTASWMYEFLHTPFSGSWGARREVCHLNPHSVTLQVCV